MMRNVPGNIPVYDHKNAVEKVGHNICLGTRLGSCGRVGLIAEGIYPGKRLW